MVKVGSNYVTFVLRAKEKEKLKQKKLDARVNNLKLGPSRKELKHSKMCKSSCKIRVAIDLSFDELMNDKVSRNHCVILVN